MYIREDVRKIILQLDSNFFNTINEESILNEENIEDIFNNSRNDLSN